MIINYPTALYKNVIPHNPGDGGNVTFTISNNPPPRTNLAFIKIPAGIAIKQKDPVVPTVTTRADVGELIYSVNSANRSNDGNTAKQYELGQVLDFTLTSPVTVSPMLVSHITEIQHNNNVIDLASFGITGEQQQQIAAEANSVIAALNDRLNVIKRTRSNVDIEINTIQKSINDIGKTINALTVMNDNAPSTEVSAIIDNLQTQSVVLNAKLDANIHAANQLATEASSVLDSIRVISTVVK